MFKVTLLSLGVQSHLLQFRRLESPSLVSRSEPPSLVRHSKPLL